MATMGPVDSVEKQSLYDPRFQPERPPAAAIPHALAATEHALTQMTDATRFEDLAIVCLQDLDPSLRPTGGPGDRQRDAVGGPLFEDERSVMTVSLSGAWAQKVVSDLVGLIAKPPQPERVVAVTNRKTSARRRNELECDARTRFGLTLRVLDRRFLALRLLRRELLAYREEFLGLPMPAPPVALEGDVYQRTIATVGSRADVLYGRDHELASLLGSLTSGGTCALEGPGGAGKTRLALEAAHRVSARMLFMDDRTQLTAPGLPAELAGADHLVLVIDNAHRREDLRQLVGLLNQRSGQTNVILIGRPGFRSRLSDAVEGSPLGPLQPEAIIELAPLAPLAIGEIVRHAEPALPYSGAVDRIVSVAEGNPLIALLAHSVAVDGGALDQFGRDQILAEHARSLVASLTARADNSAEHEILELLAVVAALGYLDLAETDTTATVAELLDASGSRVRRRLHDFADAGLVTQSAERFALTPDILSGHILWSSFFAARPAVGLPYATVWEKFSSTRIERLCNALGGLPSRAVAADHPAAKFVAGQLIARARTDPAALELTRAVAPAFPSLAAAVVDVALDHLPAEPSARARSLVAASDALARTPDFNEGWPRQLAVAQAIYALRGSNEAEPARKPISNELTRVYSRVPVAVGPHDAHVLAEVQYSMVRTSRDFWRRRRTQAGAAEAVAVAARQLLTVTFENNYTSPEDDRTIHLRGCAIPASQWTRDALTTGAELFVDTIDQLDPAMQLEQVAAAENIARASRRYPGSFGIQVRAEVAAQAQAAEALLVDGLRTRGTELPMVTRAALEDQFGEIWSDDQELHEFHLLFSSSAGPRRQDGWEDAGREERAVQLAELLLSGDPATVARRWSGWLVEAQRVDREDLGGYVLQRALELAVLGDRLRIEPVLDLLLADLDPLAVHLAAPLAVTFDGPLAQPRAERALESEHALVRAVAVRAVGYSRLPNRIPLLSRMVHDEARDVRRAVVDVLRLGANWGPTHLDLAIEASRPDDVHSLTKIIYQLKRRGSERGLALNDEQAARVAEIVCAASAGDRLPGHQLQAVIDFVAAQQPRLAIEFCRARVAHQQADTRVRDLHALMRVDSLPDEMREHVRAASSDEDVTWVLDQIETTAPSDAAHGTLTDLLEWLDDGTPTITMRMAKWLRSSDHHLRYEGQRILDHTISADAFRARARKLLESAASGELEETIISARHPRVWSGTLHRFWRRLRDEFSTWVDDSDEGLADIGRGAVAYYQRLLEQEKEPEEDGDEDD